jgi:hypothetical protein
MSTNEAEKPTKRDETKQFSIARAVRDNWIWAAPLG